MRATIDVECTPAEARGCFGVPDFEPMQAAVMERLQKRMLSEIDKFSPESRMNQWSSGFNQWLSGIPQNVEGMQAMFANWWPPSDARPKATPRRASRH